MYKLKLYNDAEEQSFSEKFETTPVTSLLTAFTFLLVSLLIIGFMFLLMPKFESQHIVKMNDQLTSHISVPIDLFIGSTFAAFLKFGILNNVYQKSSEAIIINGTILCSNNPPFYIDETLSLVYGQFVTVFSKPFFFRGPINGSLEILLAEFNIDDIILMWIYHRPECVLVAFLVFCFHVSLILVVQRYFSNTIHTNEYHPTYAQYIITHTLYIYVFLGFPSCIYFQRRIFAYLAFTLSWSYVYRFDPFEPRIYIYYLIYILLSSLLISFFHTLEALLIIAETIFIIIAPLKSSDNNNVFESSLLTILSIVFTNAIQITNILLGEIPYSRMYFYTQISQIIVIFFLAYIRMPKKPIKKMDDNR